ncbi:MAG: DUF4340 domain-containing protein [Ignavibacteriae bacterium]|nr:MAG: DUF4340 domain-containing protein [Ignavibacteriota bacterium]
MNKSTRNLLIIFVLLAAVVFIFFKGKDRVTTEKIDEKLFNADSAKIDKIEIVRTNESITLEKVNGIWQVSKPVVYPADTLAILPLLGDLQNFKVESIISENPEKFSGYLDSANNTVVTVYQEGKNLGSFILGKSAISFKNSYIKKQDENKIFLASNLTQSNFIKSLKDFRNKIIIQIPSLAVTSVSFKSTDSNKVDFTVRKDSVGKWFIGTDSVSEGIMTGFLNLIANYNTEDFVDSTITSFPEPTYTITINSGRITVINLYKMNTTPASYYIQVSGINQIFKGSEGFVTTITKKRTDFISTKP